MNQLWRIVLHINPWYDYQLWRIVLYNPMIWLPVVSLWRIVLSINSWYDCQLWRNDLCINPWYEYHCVTMFLALIWLPVATQCAMHKNDNLVATVSQWYENHSQCTLLFSDFVGFAGPIICGRYAIPATWYKRKRLMLCEKRRDLSRIKDINYCFIFFVSHHDIRWYRGRIIREMSWNDIPRFLHCRDLESLP